MASSITIAVFAESPIAGRCCRGLFDGYSPEWAAGLCAAMLRDTLDGLLSIDAARYVVHGIDADEEALAVLRRHVHAPWGVVAPFAAADDDFTIWARSDAPAADVGPLSDLAVRGAASEAPFVVAGASSTNGLWLVAANRAARARNAEYIDPLRLPDATIVRETNDVLTLLDELRRHPERAPRSAQFIVTHA